MERIDKDLEHEWQQQQLVQQIVQEMHRATDDDGYHAIFGEVCINIIATLLNEKFEDSEQTPFHLTKDWKEGSFIFVEHVVPLIRQFAGDMDKPEARYLMLEVFRKCMELVVAPTMGAYARQKKALVT